MHNAAKSHAMTAFGRLGGLLKKANEMSAEQVGVEVRAMLRDLNQIVDPMTNQELGQRVKEIFLLVNRGSRP